MKKFLGTMFLAGTILFNTATTSAAPAQDKETIYQVALLQSLALGYFDGSITVKDLKTHGDTGIGTFEGLDGEMIVLDGVVYRANQNCRVNVMGNKELVPFSNVTFFEKDFSVKLRNLTDKSAFESALNAQVDKHGINSFYMVKVHGDFNEILIRSESGQVKPYPTLVEALKATQKEMTCQSISGTLVGLYCPEFMSSLNSTGWHVLDLHLDNGEAQFDKTDNFRMGLPKAKNFQELNFNKDLKEDIRKAEQDSYQGGK